MEKQCVVCKFNKKVENHHLQKYIEYGSDDESNLVYLCPNHHWIADFGDDEDKLMLLSKIKEITGKEPIIDYNKKQYYEKLIRAQIENNLGEYTDEKYESDMLNSYNHEWWRKFFMSRPKEHDVNSYIREAEARYLIKLLNKEVKDAQESRRPQRAIN